jgi:hypothetical protein
LSLKIPHHLNNEKIRVRRGLIQSFMTKFNYSLEKPEAISAARKDFNKASFNYYKQILNNKVFNIDQTGFSIVPTR